MFTASHEGDRSRMFVERLRGLSHFIDFARAFRVFAGVDLSLEAGAGGGKKRDRLGRHWFALPLLAGSETLGHLRVGPVRLRPRRGDATTRVLTRAQLDSCLWLLRSFTKSLVDDSNGSVVRRGGPHSPTITRALLFIAERYQDEINLVDVAKASFISASYLCRLFKAEVMVSFTEYLQRLRVEKAKVLLCDRCLRVSEACFASGFQSLSQFNRVFRRMTGSAPIEWRSRHGIVTVSGEISLRNGRTSAPLL